MYLLYRILVIILIISFITGIFNIVYEHKHHLKKESSDSGNVESLTLEEGSKEEIVIDDEEII